MRSDIIISVTMSMVVILIFLGLFLIFVSSPALAQLPPELPQVFIDTTFVPPTGSTIFVPAGGDFQAALDSASCGDTISLEAGATFIGNFMLRDKGDCTGNWIVIRSSAGDSNFPAEGERVSPAHASFMPRILTPNAFPAIETERGADHYRLMFIEVGGVSGITINYNLVIFFRSSYITADRTIVCGNDNGNFRRGYTLEGTYQAVIDSYVCRIHEVGADSQAIAGFSGRGPFKIVNNYLEGAGENVMFGGSPSPQDVVPSDIEIRHNYFFKPLKWRIEDANYAGTPWSVKNLFELKNARRVLIEGNIFENSWVHGQAGYALLFTPRASSPDAPWSAVQDITFRLNIVKNSYSGFQLDMRDWPNPSQVTVDVEIENNLFILNVSMGKNPPGGNSGRVIQFSGNGPGDYGFKHNTFIMPKGMGIFMLNLGYVDGQAQPKKGVVVSNNIVSGGWLGISGVGSPFGEDIFSINSYLPGSVIKSNVFVGRDAIDYPSGNFFPPDRQDIGFINFAGGDYHLASTSPYKNAGTDGKDIGADIDAIIAATVGVITGGGTGGGTPPPPGDMTPPQISGVAATSISSNSAVITWNTNELANTQVEYGLTSGYGSLSSLGTSLVTSHSIILSGLQPNTIYHYRVHSADGSGNSAVSSNNIFTTTLVPPTSDLLAHWKFDDVIGTTTNDDSGNGNTGTLVNNPTWTAGMIGGALNFDGTNDYVEIPHTGNFLTDDGTISFWFKADSLTTQQGLWSKDSTDFDTGGHLSIYLDDTDATVKARLQSTSQSFVVFSPTIVADRWYHVAFTFGSGGMKLFLDAGTPSTNSYTGGLATTSGGSGNFEPIAIGVLIWNSDDLIATPIRAPFQGIIDDVRIYNRALSASEILLFYNIATDTTPPQISITSPTDNSVVSGVVTINVFASDDTAVSHVEIYKDNLLFVSDSSSPYQAIWNTTNELNGLHVLSATAFDAAGNSDSATINVNVNNIYTCFFTQAYWSTGSAIEGQTVNLTDSAIEGQTVKLIVEGSNCDGELIDFEIWEQDNLNPDDPVNLSTSSQGWLFVSGKATSLWVAEWQCDGRVGIFCTAGNPEYYFNSILRSDNSTSIKSNLLNVLSAKDVSVLLQKNTYSFSKISPGDLAIMKNFDPEIGIKEIQIEVNSEAQNVSITVTKHDGKPVAVSVKKSGKVFQYLQIDSQNLDDKLERATVRFRVGKLWVSGNGLDVEDVAVYGFDESSENWNELATTYAGEDSDYYYYDTELTSFGYFAISAETSVETGEAGEAVTETGVAPGEEEKRSLVLQWILIIVGILIVAVLLAIGWRIYKFILNMRE